MDRSINMTVGEKIKFFRTQLGTTQKELAERCDVVESTIEIMNWGNVIRISICLTASPTHWV